MLTFEILFIRIIAVSFLCEMNFKCRWVTWVCGCVGAEVAWVKWSHASAGSREFIKF